MKNYPTALFWIIPIAVAVVLVVLEIVWHPRLNKQRTIAGAFWLLPLWFAVGAMPTYLLGALCAADKGEAALSSVSAIFGALLVGLGVMSFSAVHHVDMALGARRWLIAWWIARRGRIAGQAIVCGLLIASVPLWWPGLVSEAGTPEARQALVNLLQDPDASLRLRAADALGDIGTQNEVPALKKAWRDARESGDRERERTCDRALKRIQHR